MNTLHSLDLERDGIQFLTVLLLLQMRSSALFCPILRVYWRRAVSCRKDSVDSVFGTPRGVFGIARDRIVPGRAALLCIKVEEGSWV